MVVVAAARAASMCKQYYSSYYKEARSPENLHFLKQRAWQKASKKASGRTGVDDAHVLAFRAFAASAGSFSMKWGNEMAGDVAREAAI